VAESIIKTGIPNPASFPELDEFIKGNKPEAIVALPIETDAQADRDAGDVVSLGLPGESVVSDETDKVTANAVQEPAAAPVETSSTVVPAAPLQPEAPVVTADEDRIPADEIFSLNAGRPKTMEAVAPPAADLIQAPPATSSTAPPVSISDATGTVAETVKAVEKSFKPLKEERLIFPEIFGELIEENF
jgi:hypothetical protein